MLTRTYINILKLSFSKYYNPDDMQAQRLTRTIVDAKSNNQLKKIIEKNQGKFNLVHISALLKKINIKNLQEQTLINLVYEQVKRTFKNIQSPNRLNARAIANVIGYTGNRRYHGIDEQIKNINFNALLMLVNEKQFVMAVTGVLKLDLVEQIIKRQQLNHIIKQHIRKNDNFGLLVSLWRNLIKSNKINSQLNKLFANKLSSVSLSRNLKDLGYFIYCYTQSYNSIQNSQQLLKLLKKSSQNILQSTRINIYQLCIFVEHLAKLSQISPLQMSKQFIQLLNTHYIRIITQKVDLRSLANGFLSMQSFKIIIGKIDQQCYQITAYSFVQKLIQNWENINDYQSVTSLFVQLITNCPQNLRNFKPNQYLTNYYKNPLSTTTNIIDPLLNFVFNKKTIHIKKMSNKQYQKFIYGLYLYKKQYNTFVLQQQHIAMIKQSLLQRKQISQIQLNSILVCFVVLNIRDQSICQYVRSFVQEKKYNITANALNVSVSGRDCMMGLKKQQCRLVCKNQNKQNK